MTEYLIDLQENATFEIEALKGRYSMHDCMLVG